MSDAMHHAELTARIQTEFDKALADVREGTLRIKALRYAMKEARKSIHKERLSAIHKAQREIHNAKTEGKLRQAKAALKRAEEAYHSGLQKIHAKYKPGGGSYSY